MGLAMVLQIQVRVDVGSLLSLVLTNSGLPRIAYFDVTNRSLKLAAYDGVEWQIHVVDAPLQNDEKGFVGKATTLALDAQRGGLVVGYHFGNLIAADGTTSSGCAWHARL